MRSKVFPINLLRKPRREAYLDGAFSLYGQNMKVALLTIGKSCGDKNVVHNPTFCLVTMLITAPPLKNGNRWDYSTQGEEETSNLNPGKSGLLGD